MVATQRPVDPAFDDLKVVDFTTAHAARREKLGGERPSITHKFSVAGHEGYLTIGMYDDGRPGEVFITMSKQGSTIRGLMDSIGTCISIGLQYGVPIGVFCNKLAYTRFEPSGFSRGHPAVKEASSVLDYVGRYLAHRFLDEAPPQPKRLDDEV